MNEDPSKKELVWLVHVYHVDRVRPMRTWSEESPKSVHFRTLCCTETAFSNLQCKLVPCTQSDIDSQPLVLFLYLVRMGGWGGGKGSISAESKACLHLSI